MRPDRKYWEAKIPSYISCKSSSNAKGASPMISDNTVISNEKDLIHKISFIKKNKMKFINWQRLENRKIAFTFKNHKDAVFFKLKFGGEND